MRATPKEKQAAFEEGVFFRMECAPTRVIGDKSVSGVCFNKPDGGEEVINCDVLILAVGQVPQPPAWLEHFDVLTDEQGIIRVDENGRTSNARIYAGGDNTHGPDLVVTAVAAGRRAADGMLDSFRPARRVLESFNSPFRPLAKQPDSGLVAART